MTKPDLEKQVAVALGAADAGRCDRDEDLASYAAGDLDPQQALAFENHLADCADCSADLAQFEATGELWRTTPEEPVPDRGRWRLFGGWNLAPSFGAGALAVAAAMFWVVPTAPPANDGPPSVRLLPKGGNQLIVAVERHGEAFRGVPGGRLFDGDRLGFFYTAPQPTHLMLFHADTAGEITRLFPVGGDRSAGVAAGTKAPLPDGALLSPSPRGCEWIVAFFSPQPLAGADATAAVEQMLAGRIECQLAVPPRDDAEVRVFGFKR